MAIDWRIGVVGALVLVALGALFFAMNSGSGVQTPVTVNFMGTSVLLTPVNGEDVPCIGAPSGYTRVYFDKTEDEYGTYTTVGYARKGDDMEAVRAWFEEKARTCGFEPVQSSQGAAMGVRGVSLEYRKQNEDLLFDVAVVKGDDGQTYTLVRIGLDVYKEVQEETSEETTEEEGTVESVPADVSTWSEQIQPILASVFGGATLKTYIQISGEGGAGYGLSFSVPRAVEAEDAMKIANAFVSAGWQQIVAGVQEGKVTVVVSKENTLVSVEASIGEKTVDVSVATS